MPIEDTVEDLLRRSGDDVIVINLSELHRGDMGLCPEVIAILRQIARFGSIAATSFTIRYDKAGIMKWTIKGRELIFAKKETEPRDPDRASLPAND